MSALGLADHPGRASGKLRGQLRRERACLDVRDQRRRPYAVRSDPSPGHYQIRRGAVGEVELVVTRERPSRRVVQFRVVEGGV